VWERGWNYISQKLKFFFYIIFYIFLYIKTNFLKIIYFNIFFLKKTPYQTNKHMYHSTFSLSAKETQARKRSIQAKHTGKPSIQKITTINFTHVFFCHYHRQWEMIISYLIILAKHTASSVPLLLHMLLKLLLFYSYKFEARMRFISRIKISNNLGFTLLF
jgi:hypothetical protein